MERALIHDKIHYWLLVLIGFCIPLTKEVLPLLVAGLVVNWVVSGQPRHLLSLGKKKGYVLLFSAYYLMHLVGLAYSENLQFGLFDLEIKLSLLLFPLLLSTSKLLNPSQQLGVVMAFIWGCLFGVLLSLGNGFYQFYLTKDISCIYYSQLSLFHHPGYYSMYLCLSIVLGAYYLIYQKAMTTRTQRMVFSTVIPLFSIFITLLMSKIGIICLGLVLLAGLFVVVVVEKQVKKGIVLTLTGGLLFMGLYNTAPRPFTRFETAATVYMDQNENLEINSAESTTARLLVWPIALQMGWENPLLGVGTGDIKDELIKQYEAKDLKGVLDRKFNVHNQFLQSFAALGLLGFLAFLLGFCIPLYQCIKTRDWMYGGFIAIVVLNCTIESILEVQAGVIFFAFFNSFFAFNQIGKKNMDHN